MVKRDSRKLGIVGAAIAGMALLALPASVSAQQAQQQEEEAPWVKICNNDPNSNRELCMVGKELFAPTGQFITSASLRQFSGDQDINLVVAVPPGMLLQPGMRVQVDGGKQLEITYDICFPNLCVGNVKVDGEFVNSMKAGGQLTISALNQGQNVVAVPLSLIGFTKAYDGEGLDPSGAQTQRNELNQALQQRAQEARRKLIERQQQTGN